MKAGAPRTRLLAFSGKTTGLDVLGRRVDFRLQRTAQESSCPVFAASAKSTKRLEQHAFRSSLLGPNIWAKKCNSNDM